jgi:hypothetical protein
MLVKFHENSLCFSEVILLVQRNFNMCFIELRTCVKYYKTKLKVIYICSICILVSGATRPVNFIFPRLITFYRIQKKAVLEF